MKKWQNMSSKFLVAVLLSANLVSVAPTVQAVSNGEYQAEVSVIVSENDAVEDSSSVIAEDAAVPDKSVSDLDSSTTSDVTTDSQAVTDNGITTDEADKEIEKEVAVEEDKKETVSIQMLGLNDYHGAIGSTGTAYIDGQSYRDTGKASNLAAHLDEAQAKFETANDDAYTERVQGGDLVGGSPANSALLQDEPTIKIFNKMNFGVGTIGNHEFDEGLAEFKRIMDGVAPQFGQFNQIVDTYPREKSTQEVVLANVVNKADGPAGKSGEVPYGFKPYTIKEYGKADNKVKVGYIGIVTTEFTSLVLKQHHEDYQVLDEAETIVQYSQELRKQGVNAIVIVSHLAATSSKEVVKGEVVDVMAKVDALDVDNSVDVVFAGHNHQFTNGVVKGTKNDIRVVQNTSQGKAYIDLQGELDLETQDLIILA